MHHIRWLNYCFFLLFIGLAGCQTVEYTGRSQVNLISDAQEKQLGAEAYTDILKKTPISKRVDWQAQLQRVGQRIAAAAARSDYQWALARHGAERVSQSIGAEVVGQIL